jgi:hypothetical protein
MLKNIMELLGQKLIIYLQAVLQVEQQELKLQDLAFGDINPNSADTTTYNGTTWTEVNNLNTGRNTGGSAVGIQTAAL